MGCGLSNPEKKIISKKIDKMEQRVKKRKEIEKLAKIKGKKINNLKQLQNEGKESEDEEDKINKIKTNKGIRTRGRSDSVRIYENKLRGKVKKKTNIIPNVKIRKNFIIMGNKKRPGSEHSKKVRTPK